jgi:hypothetical protein
VLLAGLAFSIHTGWRIAQEATRTRTLQAALPVTCFLTLATLGFLALFMA